MFTFLFRKNNFQKSFKKFDPLHIIHEKHKPNTQIFDDFNIFFEGKAGFENTTLHQIFFVVHVIEY